MVLILKHWYCLLLFAYFSKLSFWRFFTNNLYFEDLFLFYLLFDVAPSLFTDLFTSSLLEVRFNVLPGFISKNGRLVLMLLCSLCFIFYSLSVSIAEAFVKVVFGWDLNISSIYQIIQNNPSIRIIIYVIALDYFKTSFSLSPPLSSNPTLLKYNGCNNSHFEWPPLNEK